MIKTHKHPGEIVLSGVFVKSWKLSDYLISLPLTNTVAVPTLVRAPTLMMSP